MKVQKEKEGSTNGGERTNKETNREKPKRHERR